MHASMMMMRSPARTHEIINHIEIYSAAVQNRIEITITIEMDRSFDCDDLSVQFKSTVLTLISIFSHLNMSNKTNEPDPNDQFLDLQNRIYALRKKMPAK